VVERQLVVVLVVLVLFLVRRGALVRRRRQRELVDRSRESNVMRDHIKVLGWLHVAGGVVMLMLGFFFGSLFGVAGLFAERGQDAMILGGIGAAFAIFIGVLGLPSLICGWGLLTCRRWSRVLGIVLSILHVPNVPLGTLLGGYGLWVLMNDDARRLLEAGDPRLRAIPRGW
jgi:hypothetical protein